MTDPIIEVPTVVQVGDRQFGLGRDPLPRDGSDWLLREAAPERMNGATSVTRKMYKMVNPDFRIDQGPEGTCVGHGCTNVLMAGPTEHLAYAEFATTTSAHLYARKLYYEASGDDTYQKGTYTRLALEVLKNRGQIAAYYRLASVDEVKATLLNVGPVTFGSWWYGSMFYPIGQYNNKYLKVDAGSGLAGGHLYCLTGIDLEPDVGPPYVRMQNSWGPGWGQNGTARISIDDLGILYDGDAFVLTENIF